MGHKDKIDERAWEIETNRIKTIKSMVYNYLFSIDFYAPQVYYYVITMYICFFFSFFFL